MNNLEYKIQEIDTLLNCISDSLSTLTEDNFDKTLEELNSSIKQYLSLKDDLKKRYPTDIYENYESSRIQLTKQIRQKFDNIISGIRTEQDLIKSELVNIQNQKKLTNYNR